MFDTPSSDSGLQGETVQVVPEGQTNVVINYSESCVCAPLKMWFQLSTER